MYLVTMGSNKKQLASKRLQNKFDCNMILFGDILNSVVSNEFGYQTVDILILKNDMDADVII